jgi:hypothetical protein
LIFEGQKAYLAKDKIIPRFVLGIWRCLSQQGVLFPRN